MDFSLLWREGGRGESGKGLKRNICQRRRGRALKIHKCGWEGGQRLTYKCQVLRAFEWSGYVEGRKDNS
jgi:hypothetical protein